MYIYALYIYIYIFKDTHTHTHTHTHTNKHTHSQARTGSQSATLTHLQQWSAAPRGVGGGVSRSGEGGGAGAVGDWVLRSIRRVKTCSTHPPTHTPSSPVRHDALGDLYVCVCMC